MLPLKHPSQHYIYFLISRRSLSAEAILADLEAQGLPVPHGDLDDSGAAALLAQIRLCQAEAGFPPGFNPRNSRHEPTQHWLRKHKIADLWGRDPAAQQAMEYLLDPHVARMLMVLLLGPISHAAIADRTCKHFDLDPRSMNARTVRFFGHYFWNYDLLSTQEWKNVLKRWVVGDSMDMAMAVSSPRSSVGAALTICMADQGVSESLKEVVAYRYVRDTAFMEFAKVATTMHSSMNKSIALNTLVDAMVKGQDQLDRRRGGSAELLDELRRIEATYDISKLTTIKELPLERLPDVIDIQEYEILPSGDEEEK